MHGKQLSYGEGAAGKKKLAKKKKSREDDKYTQDNTQHDDLPF
jgi:hypothetical protein